MLARNIICSRNYWSYRNVVLCVAIPAVLLTASGTLAHAQVLEDFKDRDRVREWKVVADPQVPGATGQLSSAEGVRDGSLRLDFDFNCEGGEGGRDRCDSRSIGVTKKLATAAPGEVLSLWVRCTACEIGLAVTDGSGQRLRYTPASLPLSARSLDAWRRVIVSLPRNVTGHAGGANDGKFHPGVQEIHVEAKKDRLLGSRGRRRRLLAECRSVARASPPGWMPPRERASVGCGAAWLGMWSKKRPASLTSRRSTTT